MSAHVELYLGRPGTRRRDKIAVRAQRFLHDNPDALAVNVRTKQSLLFGSTAR